MNYGEEFDDWFIPKSYNDRKPMNKRIILCGPTCAGKTYIRDKFREKGYQIDVSYTSRQPRLPQ